MSVMIAEVGKLASANCAAIVFADCFAARNASERLLSLWSVCKG